MCNIASYLTTLYQEFNVYLDINEEKCLDLKGILSHCASKEELHRKFYYVSTLVGASLMSRLKSTGLHCTTERVPSIISPGWGILGPSAVHPSRFFKNQICG